ncbi:MAG: substrate-binding domain-containing protein [Verrucomicrobia bacterium]|nr:substrate-binding domain-containing protein [Verrucomicrobiota bacterium]
MNPLKRLFLVEGIIAVVFSTVAFSADKAYDGGTAVNPKDLKGKKIVLADVPKLIGIGYFDATARGIAEGCAELTKKGLATQVTTDAPTEGDIQKQIEFIDNAISRGVDGIFFAANDPVAISPVLRKALKSGIHVIGYDAESQPDAREWFMQMATPDGVAKALIDELAKEVGEKADVALITSSLTAAGQNAWIAEIKKYIPAAHPGLNLVTILPAEEDQQLAFKVTGQILKAYPSVKGIIGLSSVAFPGAADAITQANLIGKIAVVGLSTPNQMKPFIKNGAVKTVILWNPVDLGYAAAYAMRGVVDGNLKPGDTEFEAGKLGKLKIINGSQILLGPPFVFTKENIDQFNF